MTDTTLAQTLRAVDLDSARRAFRDELLDAGLLLDAGRPGLYGRSAVFEDVLDGLDRAIVERMSSIDAERVRFPPVVSRDDFDRTDYVASFPHLTAAVYTFAGSDREHARLLSERAQGQDWNHWLSPAETMLLPAVCHPLYARLTGSLPEGGRVFDLQGYAFRNEPSDDPMRLQAFRMHEFVYVGEPETARAFRNTWSSEQLALLRDLGLDAEQVAANDPFFGRAGRMLARNQLADELKLEVVVPIYGDLGEATAVGSGNSHGDHFGTAFGITTSDGSVAHSACVGWGMERITLALLRTHGLDPRQWPSSIRGRLGLS